MRYIGIEAWCECGHHVKWHPNGGSCTYWTDRIEAGQIIPVICDTGCEQLRLGHVDVDVFDV